MSMAQASWHPACLGRLGGLARVLAGLFLMVWATVSAAQGQSDFVNSVLTDRALAAFGFVAVPNETAATLDYQVASGDAFNFSTTQLGGGFRPVAGGRLYLEGFLGWQSFDPALLRDPDLGVGTGTREQQILNQAQWSSRAATGAVGYNFDVSPHLTVRPALHLAVGEVASDGSLVPDIPLLPGFGNNDGVPQIGGGRLATGGYGASLGLEYRLREPGQEIDLRARQTWMRLVELDSDPRITSQANAIVSSLYGRYRHPIRDWHALDRPLRAVWEASVSAYPGDQGRALDTPWLAQIGAGLELETSALPLPYLDRVRLVARYAVGESYDGYSIGLGIALRRTR